MKITNNSVKLVNIGPEAVMPGATAEVADTWADVPAIQCLERMGIITVTKTKAKKTEEKAEEKVEATAEATVETPAETEVTADDAEDTGVEIKSKRSKKQ